MKISIKTKGNNDIINITDQVQKAVEESKIKEGTCFVFVPHSTCAISTIEYEPGLIQDIKDALERIAPVDAKYAHDDKWGDGNGYAHIRATFMKPSFVVPIEKGRLMLGTWQQIILIDFDNRAREREIIIKIF